MTGILVYGNGNILLNLTSKPKPHQMKKKKSRKIRRSGKKAKKSNGQNDLKVRFSDFCQHHHNRSSGRHFYVCILWFSPIASVTSRLGLEMQKTTSEKSPQKQQQLDWTRQARNREIEWESQRKKNQMLLCSCFEKKKRTGGRYEQR